MLYTKVGEFETLIPFNFPPSSPYVMADMGGYDTGYVIPAGTKGVIRQHRFSKNLFFFFKRHPQNLMPIPFNMPYVRMNVNIRFNEKFLNGSMAKGGYR